MVRLLTLGSLALLAVAEVAAVVALVNALGPGSTLLVLGLDVLAGLAIVRWAARGPAQDRGWRMAAGAIIALPGLVLDLVGALMLVPRSRAWLKAHLARRTETLLRRSGVSMVTVTDPAGMRRTTVVPGDVIAGEVVESDVVDNPDPGAGPAGDPPDATPRVVRGEITD